MFSAIWVAVWVVLASVEESRYRNADKTDNWPWTTSSAVCGAAVLFIAGPTTRPSRNQHVYYKSGAANLGCSSPTSIITRPLTRHYGVERIGIVQDLLTREKKGDKDHGSTIHSCEAVFQGGHCSRTFTHLFHILSILPIFRDLSQRFSHYRPKASDKTSVNRSAQTWSAHYSQLLSPHTPLTIKCIDRLFGVNRTYILL